MSIDERTKPQTSEPRTDKQSDKVADLPDSQTAAKDEQVKGGRMPQQPRDM